MSDIFDSSFFAKLNHLQLVQHMRLDQGQTGARKSSAKGSSVEFSDFREYLPGDDIRRIDWNAYGRLDRLYIKQFMEEKEAFYHILLDTSASMDFGAEKKSIMALQLAAAFAWIILKQLDRVEILTCHDGRLDKMSAVTGRTGFNRLLGELEQLSFTGSTHLNDGVRRLAINGKGTCILISDFLDPEGIEEALRYLAYKRQEIILIQILSPEELHFEEEGTLSLTDVESGQEVRITMTRQTIEAYQQTLAAHNEKLQKLAKRYGATWLSLTSDQPIDTALYEARGSLFRG